jgi:flavin-dependent dehydrogenase
MRIAMLSGHLAARALVEGRPQDYDRLWRRRFGRFLAVSVSNRYAFARMGNRGYVRFMRTIAHVPDSREWLRRHYAPSFGKSVLFRVARRQIRSRRDPPGCAMTGCDCTWCRAHPHAPASFPGPRLTARAAASSSN